MEHSRDTQAKIQSPQPAMPLETIVRLGGAVKVLLVPALQLDMPIASPRNFGFKIHCGELW